MSAPAGETMGAVHSALAAREAVGGWPRARGRARDLQRTLAVKQSDASFQGDPDRRNANHHAHQPAATEPRCGTVRRHAPRLGPRISAAGRRRTRVHTAPADHRRPRSNRRHSGRPAMMGRSKPKPVTALVSTPGTVPELLALSEPARESRPLAPSPTLRARGPSTNAWRASTRALRRCR